jgi:septal ring factor EnvC (AmiA/AmiB activator)
MKKIWVLLFFVIVALLSAGIPALAFSGPQTELSSSQRAKTELAQLNFFDDPNVDKRITELQRRIDVGKRSGQLTPDEASRLQTSLDGLKARIAKYRNDGFMSKDERAKANEMLTALEERVRAERTDDDVAQRDAVGRRVADLQRRIDAGSRAGQLTRDEASQLQAALNRIKERDARYRADGSLTNEERIALNQMLNTLEERIRYEKNDTDVVHREAFERRISEMKRRIEAGLRAGQLTLDEACSLQAIFNRIKERDAQFRSDGVLTREERMRLNRMLAHLEERIHEERWDADIDNPLFR